MEIDRNCKYVSDPGLAYSVDVTGTAQVYYSDGLGSIRAVADGNGWVIQSYQTDEFGVPTLTQGSSAQSFQYTGEQSDAETGLLYLRARYYDPQTGRFIGRDPIAGLIVGPVSLNRYPYAQNVLTTFNDPSGMRIPANLKNPGAGMCGEDNSVCIVGAVAEGAAVTPSDVAVVAGAVIAAGVMAAGNKLWRDRSGRTYSERSPRITV